MEPLTRHLSPAPPPPPPPLPELVHSKFQEYKTASTKKIAALEKHNKEMTTELEQLRARTSQQIGELTQEVKTLKEKNFRFERIVLEQTSDLEA